MTISFKTSTAAVLFLMLLNVALARNEDSIHAVSKMTDSTKKPECALCTYSSQCTTNHCLHGRCIVRNSKESDRKCRVECAVCTKDHHCHSYFCYKRRCAFRVISRREYCFSRPSPTPSRTPTPTPSTSPTPSEMPEPVGAGNGDGDMTMDNEEGDGTLPECARCSSHADCSGGHCNYRFCTDGSWASKVRCGVDKLQQNKW